jgi:DNA-binding MarR family transcriptional regulator
MPRPVLRPVNSDVPAAPELPHDGLLGRIVRLNLIVTSVLEALTEQAGISLGDYLVLGVIRRSPGRRSAPTAICEVLGRTTGGMTLTLDRLESAGWVTRTTDPSDRRRVVVQLTDEGLRLATSVNRSLHEWEATLRLPGDVSDTMAVLDDVTAAVSSGAGHPTANGSSGIAARH